MNKSIPHVIFCVSAFLFFVGAIHLDHNDRGGGENTLDHLRLYLYLTFFSVYLVVGACTLLVMRWRSGEWRFAAAYLLSVMLAPLAIYLALGTIELVEEVQNCLADNKERTCFLDREPDL